MIRTMVFACLLAFSSVPSLAQEFSALARIDPAGSVITDDRRSLQLTLSQTVPYRVYTLDGPPRLVLDFKEVDFTGFQPEDINAEDVRFGRVANGWSRLVVPLPGPLGISRADMVTQQDASPVRIEVDLSSVSAEEFARQSGAQDQRAEPKVDRAIQTDDGKLVVVIDPGHGGIDPGAVRGDVTEAELMLRFAREMKEIFARSGNYEVILTRNEDVFVSLEGRIALAHQVNADVFLSLHADAISQGIARGAQIYTLSEEASSVASAKLAERHDRDQILAGVDLTGQDDEIATVLMTLARRETEPRTEALAEAIVWGLKDRGIRLHKRARERASFSVLKAPEIPSVLIEIGFLSSPDELAKLQDASWRAKAAQALVSSIIAWEAEDKARKPLIRQ